jgi:hypothetical protein
MKTFLKLYCAAILLTVSSSAQQHPSENASPITGIWRWRFAMPDGSVANPTLRLEFEDGKLTGTSSFRAGSETAITNAIFNEKGIRFQVVRTRDDKPVVTTYVGQLAGKTINGTIESNWAGQLQTYAWHAEKLYGPNGSWEWTASIGERKFEARVNLKQNGSKLEGTLAGRGRSFRPTHIKNGVIDDDGQLSFEVETGPEDARRISQYNGKLNGDTINGTIETTFNGVSRKSDWAARRVL